MAAMKSLKLACIRDKDEIISPNHMFSVSIRDAIDTRYLYTTSLHVSYRIQNDRHDIITKVIIIFLNISDGGLIFLLPGNTMAPFLTFLALKIRIVPEKLHEIKNDYAECYLLSLKKPTHKHAAVALV